MYDALIFTSILPPVLFFGMIYKKTILGIRTEGLINLDHAVKKVGSPEQDLTRRQREFQIVAGRWGFEPKEVVVDEGDLVKLTLKSFDLAHSLVIKEYFINKTAVIGEDAEIRFVADKPGVFNFYCPIHQGEGDHTMKGRLIVRSASERR